MTTEAERRHAIEQAIANTKIEGHEPTAEFLADMEQLAQAAMTPAQVRAASLARALAADAAGAAGQDQGD
jgi:hypothetical protein